MSQISDEDKSLFAAAIEGTRKLQKTEKVAHYKPRLSSKVTKKTETDHSLTMNDDDSGTSVSGHQSLLFQRTGVRSQELQKLRKGQYQFSWQLDLHGYIEAEADIELKNFIQEALKQGIRTLLIIHGKGYNSDIEKPVLKNLVNSRLRQYSDVLAFCSALQKDGGVGAVYVLLKDKQK